MIAKNSFSVIEYLVFRFYSFFDVQYIDFNYFPYFCLSAPIMMKSLHLYKGKILHFDRKVVT